MKKQYARNLETVGGERATLLKNKVLLSDPEKYRIKKR